MLSTKPGHNSRSKISNNLKPDKPFFQGEQQSVVATEYLSGGELFARISSPDYSLTEAKCRDFMRQILKGVEFVHKSKILHLDLKPQNIVFVSNFANLDQSQKSALVICFLDCCCPYNLISTTFAEAFAKCAPK